jgi:[ribosomal protein S18]-alanine N-acetyltransferase
VIFDLVDPTTLSILNLAVAPGWRRRGVATALIEQMISHFPRGRMWRITAETQERNLGAQLFFRARGLWCRGVLKHVWRGYDADALSFVRIGRRLK